MFNNYYTVASQISRPINYHQAAATGQQQAPIMVGGFNRLHQAFPTSNAAAVAASVASVNAAAAATFTTLQLMSYGPDGSPFTDPSATLPIELLAAAASQQQQKPTMPQIAHHQMVAHPIMAGPSYGASVNTTGPVNTFASAHSSDQVKPKKPTKMSRASLESDMFRKISHEHICSLCGTKFGDKAGVIVHHPCYFKRQAMRRTNHQATSPDSTTTDGHSHQHQNNYTTAFDFNSNLSSFNHNGFNSQFPGQPHNSSQSLGHHPSSDAKKNSGGPYLCSFELCGKAFNLLYALRRHMMFHLDEMHYDCLSCGHQTKAKSDMVKHVRVHKDIKPFKCTYCPKQFSDPSALANHVRTHTGAKPFRCNWLWCNKDFRTSSELCAHKRRIHREERDFLCPVEFCLDSFVTGRERRAHLRSQHPTYNGPECY